MCPLWRVRTSQYNIGLPGPPRVTVGADGEVAGDPSGLLAPFFYSHLRRVLFFMLLSEKLTNSETAVHNTTLITLHNAIISVAVLLLRGRVRATLTTLQY